MNRLTVLRALFALAALCCVVSSPAQVYPSRPIRLIVPAATSGVTDFIGRLIGQKLSERLGQPVVIENKPGAGGNLAAEQAARAIPDGYTLLLGFTSPISINPYLYKNMGFDGLRDFVPVTLLTSYPMVLVVNASLPANSLQEFLAIARRDPTALALGSAGVATTSHLTLELLKRDAGVEILHVPFKGEAACIVALMAGDIQAVLATATVILPQLSGGKLKVLAVTSKERTAVLPDVPTFAESGLKDFEAVAWFGIMAPTGTPAPIIDRLSREITAILREPAVRAEITRRGLDVLGHDGNAFTARVLQERAMWQRLVSDARLKLD